MSCSSLRNKCAANLGHLLFQLSILTVYLGKYPNLYQQYSTFLDHVKETNARQPAHLLTNIAPEEREKGGFLGNSKL